MASNESYSITPSIIVEKNTLFRIPLYQRLFAWREPEIKQLMQDLHTHFAKPEQKPYYIGMITVVHQDDRLDLIDGQQRTTVLMLLAIGFIHALLDGKSKDNWLNFFKKSDRVFFNGRSQDRDFLRSLADGSQSNYRNTAMEDALSLIQEFLLKEYDYKTRNEFADAVFNNLTVFVTELPDHYKKNPSSLNEYFEAMNSSGKSLEQHEILKVELLKDYTGEDKLNLTRLWNVVSDFEHPLVKIEDKDDATRIQRQGYVDLISKCRSGNVENACIDFYKKNNSEGNSSSIAVIGVKKYDFNNRGTRDKEDSIISFPKFLLMVLALHTGKDDLAAVHPSKLHETFKNNPIAPNEIGDFYRELFIYRLLMDFYVVRLKYGSSSSSHTLICNTDEETDKSQRAHARLRQYQSMLDVSTESHIWVLPLLKYLKSLTSEPMQMDILKFLMQLDYMRRDHSEVPYISNLDYDSKPRYWLWRLDYALWEKLILERENAYTAYDNIDKEAIRQYEFRTNRSIEHLHPQNQNNNDEWTWEDVNSFGNLAMISAGFNSQQSNLPVHVKFANLEVQIGNKNLQSLKLYFMYLKAKRSEAEWTTTAKDEHAEEMLQILNESLEIVKSYEQGESEGKEL
ncbi:MAG: DUF262 domain-containing HNH endonuclease family protein [Muribaculum sp.]|nr:DUF262 domain-containing HNH endonuclease family protein [Muribaculum sp.]